jgi:hypothetical protein
MTVITDRFGVPVPPAVTARIKQLFLAGSLAWEISVQMEDTEMGVIRAVIDDVVLRRRTRSLKI